MADAKGVEELVCSSLLKEKKKKKELSFRRASLAFTNLVTQCQNNDIPDDFAVSAELSLLYKQSFSCLFCVCQWGHT